MRQRIRLTESQLHSIIRRCINEAMESSLMPTLVGENEHWSGNIHITYMNLPFVSNENGEGTFVFKPKKGVKDSYYLFDTPFLGNAPQEVTEIFNRKFPTYSNMESLRARLASVLTQICEKYPFQEMQDISQFQSETGTKTFLNMYLNGKEIGGTVGIMSNDNIEEYMKQAIDRYNAAYDEHLTPGDVEFKFRYSE